MTGTACCMTKSIRHDKNVATSQPFLYFALGYGAPAKQPTATSGASEDGERQRSAEQPTTQNSGFAPERPKNLTLENPVLLRGNDYVVQAVQVFLAVIVDYNRAFVY